MNRWTSFCIQMIKKTSVQMNKITWAKNMWIHFWWGYAIFLKLEMHWLTNTYYCFPVQFFLCDAHLVRIMFAMLILICKHFSTVLYLCKMILESMYCQVHCSSVLIESIKRKKLYSRMLFLLVNQVFLTYWLVIFTLQYRCIWKHSLSFHKLNKSNNIVILLLKVFQWKWNIEWYKM